MKYTAPKGTYDIYGERMRLWHYVEDVIRRLCADYNVSEIRTPVFESTELFQRGVGETTDIVQKEMFTFLDRGGRSFALRPEGTAGAARAYIENGMHNLPQPVKIYYAGPSFRGERPQKGRYRQLHQFGVEIFGSYAPAADAELISLTWAFYQRLGINGLTLRVNSIGNMESRRIYNGKLLEYLNEHADGLCETCRERMAKNPLRALDCKNAACAGIMRDAPVTLDSLTEECRGHFDGVLAALAALDIPCTVDTGVVRGLDYYTRTVFEITSDDLGAQSSVCGGGRYDNLIEDCGGQPTGAVGVGIGLDRVMLILEEQGRGLEPRRGTDIFIGAMGERELLAAQRLVYGLRGRGFCAETDTVGRSVKAQFKYADKLGAAYACMIGGNELDSGSMEIKRMADGERFRVALDDIADFISQQNNIAEVGL